MIDRNRDEPADCTGQRLAAPSIDLARVHIVALGHRRHRHAGLQALLEDLMLLRFAEAPTPLRAHDHRRRSALKTVVCVLAHRRLAACNEQDDNLQSAFTPSRRGQADAYYIGAVHKGVTAQDTLPAPGVGECVLAVILGDPALSDYVRKWAR